VRDFIEQRGKERRQERRGEKRRSDHHDSPASSSSSSSTSMDTNLDDGGGLTMRPLTPRAHSGGGSGIRGTLESGGVGAATTTTPGLASSASAALQPSPVPLLFPLRRPVHRDGRVAPVWLKTWSGTGPADGSQQATAAEAANPGDRRAAGEVTATASKKPKRATTPDNAVVDAVISNAEAETEVGRSVTDATANICRHDGERGGEAEVEEQGGEADHVQAAAAPDTAEEMTAAAPVGDEGLLDHRPVGVTNVETTDKREEVEKEENEVSSHTAQEAENCEQKMRDLEADLARLSADTSELVSLSWIPTPEAAATSTAAASSDETTTHAASPDFLKEATAPASELKERPASTAAAVGDDATTANTNTEDGTDADVALAAGGDVPSAAALVVVDDNDHQGESGQRKTDAVAEKEDPDGDGEVEEVKADEAILAFGPTLGVTSDGMRGASTAPPAATGALPPFSFADFSSSFFSSFSLPSSLYSPSPSTYSPAPLSATNTTAAPTSLSSSSSPPSSPSPTSSPALRSSTKRSLAAFLPSVGAKAGRVASPSLLPLPAAAAPLDATPTPGVDRGSTATTAAADSEEKKVGKNRRKKEQRMLKSNGNRPAISTADTDEVRPTKTDHADGSADESESEGKTEENETEKEKEEKEKTMEAELEKLERELEADRRQFVAQFASCFADLAIGGASREADADDEAKADGVATSS
jgi:hypothetical protein